MLPETAPKLSPAPTKWSRIVPVWIKPEVDGGLWPAKSALGDDVQVTGAFIVDGHDKLAVELLYRYEDEPEQIVRMSLRYNDEYAGSFKATQLGHYYYRVRAWIDQFGTWQDQFERRVKGGESEYELQSELLEGAHVLRRIAGSAKGKARTQLQEYIKAFESGNVSSGLDKELAALVRENDPRTNAVESKVLPVQVDPELARFSAWYEFFPRSAGKYKHGQPPHHATLDEAAERLPRIKDLGFDIVYLPPVHPIGTTYRKGKDNAPSAQTGEPGSPWAIGGEAANGSPGGHKSVHPALGGIEAFDRFVARAEQLGLKVALDIAFQTSPDHPYVYEHPEWYRHRPDGTIRYAENPPKKYQDVYPFDFESDEWEGLWEELRSVFTFWVEHGVRIFRVDNPHTKPFAFWEWCIGTLRAEHPDLIFLAEAFSRPKIMYHLAKLGFNQSYTYFTWRNTKQELEEYCNELFHTDVADFFRPNFWPNTPDILHEYLVHSGRPGHVARLVLAATMSPSYGIYGPPYEHVENVQHPLREEYANNEKYEIRTWNWQDPYSLQPMMKRINRIRHGNPALQFMRNIQFHTIDNPNLIAYSKRTGDNLIVTVVNLDPHHAQSGWLHLPLADLGIPEHESYEMHDLLGGERYMWQGPDNFILLNPHALPAHIFRMKAQWVHSNSGLAQAPASEDGH
ncbi:MAG TPA: alpha-1,4-glucan--maltose-1-phosphate maltosyltransferase [Rhodothermales bacterium]|nr:alpha-1,4-glucan--maltose-1-phosphate maltosyltransferase [Rhodothermales bacterium]